MLWVQSHGPLVLGNVHDAHHDAHDAHDGLVAHTCHGKVVVQTLEVDGVVHTSWGVLHSPGRQGRPKGLGQGRPGTREMVEVEEDRKMGAHTSGRPVLIWVHSDLSCNWK